MMAGMYRISGREVFASQLNTQDAVTPNWAATSFCISFSSKASAESDPRSFLPRRNLEQSATAVGLRKYDRHRFVRLIEAVRHRDVGLLHSVSFDRFFTNAGNQHLDDQSLQFGRLWVGSRVRRAFLNAAANFSLRSSLRGSSGSHRGLSIPTGH
jgi:hypothetical protein